jgi:hypothetical protein
MSYRRFDAGNGIKKPATWLWRLSVCRLIPTLFHHEVIDTEAARRISDDIFEGFVQ